MSHSPTVDASAPRPATETPTPGEAQDLPAAPAVGGRPPVATGGDGKAMDALRHQPFRRVYIGAFFSNIGTWMQNVVLGALAYDLTGSSSFVGIVLFAQLGPMLLFSMVGGLLADTFDRRRLLITISATQAVLALGLAAVARADDPSKWAIVGIVFLMGMGQSVFGPTYSAVLPDLVGPGNLAGAISLNSAQMNGSRVIGPAIGGLLFAQYGASWVFIINAATYLFVIGALLSVVAARRRRRRRSGAAPAAPRPRLPHRPLPPPRRALPGPDGGLLVPVPAVHRPDAGARRPQPRHRGQVHRLRLALRLLRARRHARRALGRHLLRQDVQGALVRWGLVAFAVSLGVFSWLRAPAPAFMVIVVVGFFYFGTVTALSTVLQLHLAGNERGRVMALWMMAFGGTVPLGNLVAGPLIDATSVTTVVFPGAVIAIGLAWWADLHRGRATPCRQRS